MTVFLTALAELTHHDVRRRDLAAETVGDLLRTGVLDDADAEAAVNALVASAVDDPDPAVQESVLHAVAEAFDHYALPLRLFQPLRSQLPAMPPAQLAEYALGILALTHDPEARPAIEAFLKNPEQAVRHAAAQAIAELPGRSGP